MSEYQLLTKNKLKIIELGGYVNLSRQIKGCGFKRFVNAGLDLWISKHFNQ